jgi:hypothetical protein
MVCRDFSSKGLALGATCGGEWLLPMISNGCTLQRWDWGALGDDPKTASRGQKIVCESWSWSYLADFL